MARQLRHLRAIAVLGCASVIVLLAGSPASADNPPPLACGTPAMPGPCAQTAHFTNQQGFETPLGTPTNASTCPDWLVNDLPFLDMTGNGVEHVNANKAQDFWATNTFTGTGTLTLYPPSSVNLVFDSQGNIVSATITGPADTILTGHITDWFGVSANQSSAVIHGTVNVTGTLTDGTQLSVHYTTHASWTPGQIPFVDAPHLSFNKVTC
ncbi:hypothetical protein [Terrabacter carboxydivorans]